MCLGPVPAPYRGKFPFPRLQSKGNGASVPHGILCVHDTASMSLGHKRAHIEEYLLKRMSPNILNKTM